MTMFTTQFVCQLDDNVYEPIPFDKLV